MRITDESAAKPFKILSLDGGGIRGAFIAGFLADLEARLDCQIADYFDLIAGTSTGAIVAAALAVHEPASRIEAFYRERGPQIFTRRKPLARGMAEKPVAPVVDKLIAKFGIDYDSLWQSKYTSDDLKKALEEVFGDKTIEQAKTRLVIPAVDLTRGQTIVFKTPHLPGMYRDRHHRIADVLLATTAAPTYFPHAKIEEGSAYVDGGLWANNPSIVAIVEALRIAAVANREGFDFPIDQTAIWLLSVGTGRAAYFAVPPTAGAGAIWWTPNIFNISSVAQSQGINFQTEYMLGDHACRIDYDLPDGTWSLDSVDMLAQMIKLGHDRAVEKLTRLREEFFNELSQHPYHPFPDAMRAAR